MGTDELLALIQDNHAEGLAHLRARLWSPSGREGPDRGPEWQRPSIGPVSSVEDRALSVTLDARVSAYSWFASDPSLTGDLYTVSIRTDHRLLGQRTALGHSEADAWALAVLGSQNALMIYWSVAVVGLVTTLCHHLYVDPAGQTARLPRGSSLAERSARISDSLD